jgi:hypothetical protein
MSGPLNRGQPTTFTANTSDPDGDRMSLTWFAAPGPCDPSALPTTPGKMGDSFMTTPMTDAAGMMCVAVVAIDRYGARSDVGSKTVMVTNAVPVARITVLLPTGMATPGGYDLYSAFRLSAADSIDTDGDPLTFQWMLMSGPPSSQRGLRLVDCLPATSPPNLVECLDPITVPGPYVVQLIANDGHADSAPVTAQLQVNEDREPCLARVSPADPAAPIDWDPTADKTFEVQKVTDDGSPYPSAAPPNGAPRFSWSLRRRTDTATTATAWEPIAGVGLASVTIPGGRFTIGDIIDVRVEVRDNAAGINVHGIDDLAACGDIGICPSTCPERDTWTINYR